MEELTEQEQDEIARLIKEGFTSGILDDSVRGERVTWSLEFNKFEH